MPDKKPTFRSITTDAIVEIDEVQDISVPPDPGDPATLPRRCHEDSKRGPHDTTPALHQESGWDSMDHRITNDPV